MIGAGHRMQASAENADHRTPNLERRAIPRSPYATQGALFVAFSGPDAGVFDSQVLEYGRFMRGFGIEFRYLLFEGARGWLRSRTWAAGRVRELSDRFDAAVELRHLPAPLSPLGLRLAARAIARTARGLLRESRAVLVQCRGPEATCAALEARRALPSLRVVYDARGDAAAEARLEGGGAHGDDRTGAGEARARRLEVLERRAAAEADARIAVSRPLRDRLCRLGGVPVDTVPVIPCCINPHRLGFTPALRAYMRHQLGVSARFVVVYSGSLSVWQIPDQVAALVTALHAVVPELYLLVLTRDAAGARRYFGALIDAGLCTVLDCPFDRVADHLAAADAALLLRRDDPVNRAACPVKFAEYQASGLPVITTPLLGDVSHYVVNGDCGVVVDLADPPADQARRVAEAIRAGGWEGRREQIRARALAAFSRDTYRPVYRALLERLGVLPSERGVGC